MKVEFLQKFAVFNSWGCLQTSPGIFQNGELFKTLQERCPVSPYVDSEVSLESTPQYLSGQYTSTTAGGGQVSLNTVDNL